MSRGANRVGTKSYTAGAAWRLRVCRPGSAVPWAAGCAAACAQLGAPSRRRRAGGSSLLGCHLVRPQGRLRRALWTIRLRAAVPWEAGGSAKYHEPAAASGMMAGAAASTPTTAGPPRRPSPRTARSIVSRRPALAPVQLPTIWPAGAEGRPRHARSARGASARVRTRGHAEHPGTSSRPPKTAVTPPRPSTDGTHRP